MRTLFKILIIVVLMFFLILLEPVSNIVYNSYNRHLDNLENERIEKAVAELCPKYTDYILNNNLTEPERIPLQLYYLTIERTTACCLKENYQLCSDFLNLSYKLTANETQLLVRVNETDWRIIDFGVSREAELKYYLKYSYYQINDSYWDYKKI